MVKKVLVALMFGVLVINVTLGSAATTYGKSMITLNSGRLLEGNSVPGEICETPGCVRAATQILDNMDPSVQPCDDFYRFACGRYIKESIIPDTKTEVNLFDKINDKLEKQLRKSIENEMSNDDPQVFKSLRTYYKTCMDTAQIEKIGDLQLRHVMKKLGGWPILEGDSWNESNFDWIKSMYSFRKTGYGFNTFFDVSVDVDSKNSSRRTLQVFQASLHLPREYLSKGLEEKIIKAYHQYLVDLAEILGAGVAKAKMELLEVVNFSIELAKITPPNEELRNATKLYNLMTVRQLESKYPMVPWTEYLNEILAPHAKVHQNEEVVVTVPSFLDKLFKLISKTPNRVLANYAMSGVVAMSAPYLDERFQNVRTKFSAVLSGVKVKHPRWKECLNNVVDDFSLAIDVIYARRYFDGSAKATAVEIIDGIRDSFRQLLIQVDWMDEETRKAALAKIEKIVSYVGYPDEFLDNEKLDEYFKHVKIYPEGFLKSHLSMILHAWTRKFEKLRKPVNKTDWIDHGLAAYVNALYVPNENSIQFPAAILQGEFFSNDRPNYLNYGGIGSVMGHEITHGFDDQGRQFDKDGNLVDWWAPETTKKFLEKAKCIIQQYSNYTVKEVGLNINGVNTQGENIADNGGFKNAYFAYTNWEKLHGQEPRLPGLPYTSQQMFWIGAANIWCEKSRPEGLELTILTDVHSPAEFRVNGPISNILEFAKDFACPPGSPMNPPKKCTVW